MSVCSLDIHKQSATQEIQHLISLDTDVAELQTSTFSSNCQDIFDLIVKMKHNVKIVKSEMCCSELRYENWTLSGKQMWKDVTFWRGVKEKFFFFEVFLMGTLQCSHVISHYGRKRHAGNRGNLSTSTRDKKYKWLSNVQVCVRQQLHT